MEKYECLHDVNANLIDEYIKKFDDNEAIDESALKLLFSMFDNSSLEAILVKVISLNQLYNAGLYSNASEKEGVMPDVYMVSRYLQSLETELSRVLTRNDVIELLTKSEKYFHGLRKKSANSFISKYLFWSNEVKINPSIKNKNDISIYDSKVKGMLYYYSKKSEEIGLVNRKEMSDYSYFCQIHERFLTHCNKITCRNYNTRDIDKFLWQYAKYIMINSGVDMGI